MDDLILPSYKWNLTEKRGGKCGFCQYLVISPSASHLELCLPSIKSWWSIQCLIKVQKYLSVFDYINIYFEIRYQIWTIAICVKELKSIKDKDCSGWFCLINSRCFALLDKLKIMHTYILLYFFLREWESRIGGKKRES